MPKQPEHVGVFSCYAIHIRLFCYSPGRKIATSHHHCSSSARLKIVARPHLSTVHTSSRIVETVWSAETSGWRGKPTSPTSHQFEDSTEHRSHTHSHTLHTYTCAQQPQCPAAMSQVLRSVKNVTKGYSSVQVKVRNGMPYSHACAGTFPLTVLASYLQRPLGPDGYRHGRHRPHHFQQQHRLLRGHGHARQTPQRQGQELAARAQELEGAGLLLARGQ